MNEEMLMENMPEDLQKDIRRHLFKYMKKVGTSPWHMTSYIQTNLSCLKFEWIIIMWFKCWMNFTISATMFHIKFCLP